MAEKFMYTKLETAANEQVSSKKQLKLLLWLDQRVLREKVGHIRHQVLDHRHVGQGIDLHVAPDLVQRLGAGQRVGAVDVHGA